MTTDTCAEKISLKNEIDVPKSLVAPTKKTKKLKKNKKQADSSVCMKHEIHVEDVG